MAAETAALIAVIALILLIAIEVPIALSLIGSALLGLILLGSSGTVWSVVGAAPFSATAKYALVVIPMYVLLGCLIANAGIGAAIYRAVNRLFGRFPGGLAATAIGATALFSGISGSSAADVAAFGKISVQEMDRYGYRKEYAAAVVAAAGAFAALIPPSISFVIYGITAQVSVAALIFAGIVPGVISCLALAAYVILRARFSPASAGGAFGRHTGETATAAVGAVKSVTPSRTSRGSAVESTGDPVLPLERSTLLGRAFRSDLMGVVYAGIIFLIVVGGLYGGVFTATEAGAIGALAALCIATFEILLKRGRLWRLLVLSFREAVGMTSMIFLLLVGGSAFGYMLVVSGLPSSLTLWIKDLDVPPQVIVAAMLLVLLPLGTILDGLTIVLITVPLMAPIVDALGFDGVWFGVLVIKMIEIGLITPPVGINAFIVSGATGAKVDTVYRYLVPFVAFDLALTAVFFLLPDLVLWLPRLAGL